MTSGPGRGRGWLNLAKNRNAAPVKPGLPPNVPNRAVSKLEQENPKIFEDVAAPPSATTPSEHAEVIRRVEHLNTTDDGILFNQKIRHVLDYWKDDCKTKEDVDKSFKALFSAALQSKDLSVKLMLIMAAPSFTKQEVHEINLRYLFLALLHENFENAEQLQTSSPQQFRNCIYMIGEFYQKAWSSNGEPYKFLVAPFCACLEMLLASKSPADISLFAKQFTSWLIRLRLKRISYPENVELITKLKLKLRKKLADEGELSTNSRLWLMLAVDVSSSDYGAVPHDIFTFYEEELGAEAVENFNSYVLQKSTPLSVETSHPSRLLDEHKSNVNVLQISNLTIAQPQDDVGNGNATNKSEEPPVVSSSQFNHHAAPPPAPSQAHYNNVMSSAPTDGTTGSGGGCGPPQQNDSSFSCASDNWSAAKPTAAFEVKSHKPSGRPILGAGARFQKIRQQALESTKEHDFVSTNSDMWNNDSTTGGSNMNKHHLEHQQQSQQHLAQSQQHHQRGGWKNAEANKGRSKKGWQHDDRFETDYNS